MQFNSMANPVRYKLAVNPMSSAGALKRLIYLFSCLIAMVLIAGCASGGKEFDPTVGWSAERLYKDAKDEIGVGNWAQAAKQLERLESRYPFGPYAQQAQIELAYVYWKDGSNAQALAAIDRFERLHPNHVRLDYLYYLRGLITFYQESAMLSSLTRQDPSERDPKGARESFTAFKTLLERFPNSPYAEDARFRLNYLLNNIAMNEVHVARLYYQKEAYVAAINRAQIVVEEFQGTPAVEEALYLLTLSYDKLGMEKLRDDTRRVLDSNFPDSSFIKHGFTKADNPWWKIW